MRSWDYQAMLIQDAVGEHPGTKPGSPEALRQLGASGAVAMQVAASNSTAPGTPRIAVDPILYPVSDVVASLASNSLPCVDMPTDVSMYITSMYMKMKIRAGTNMGRVICGSQVSGHCSTTLGVQSLCKQGLTHRTCVLACAAAAGRQEPQPDRSVCGNVCGARQAPPANAIALNSAPALAGVSVHALP